MGLAVLLRYLRLVQILFAAIVSLCLAASFLKVGGNEASHNVASHPTVQYTGIISLLFGITSIAEFFLEASFVRKPNHCVMSHAVSLGMAFFLNIFGIVLTMGSVHVIAMAIENKLSIFDREFIYLSIGSIFICLMIENFAQGRNFHAVVESRNRDMDATTNARNNKVKISTTEMIEVHTETNQKSIEKATNTHGELIEKATNTIDNDANAWTPKEIKKLVANDDLPVAEASVIDCSKEVFSTPSVIPEDKEFFVPAQDIRPTYLVSDKVLKTARKSPRKLSIPDSIFKMRTASYSTLTTEICESAEPNTTQKGYTVNEATNMCLSINENTVEVEPLPEVSVLKAANIMKLPSPPADGAEAFPVLNENSVQDKQIGLVPAPSPRPLTPLWLEAPFHSKLELTPMAKSDTQDRDPSLRSKSSDFNGNSKEDMANNIDLLN